METEADLPTLIEHQEHLNVLRYIRIHQLREPELVLKHGKALLGSDLSRKIPDELARLAALEQICGAALDLHAHTDAELCLTRLKAAGIPKDSCRFRLLLARCFESADDMAEATKYYDELLKANPSNLVALKRKYCILRAQVGKEVEASEALNAYLQHNYADAAAWYELAQLRMELGDYQGAAFALEEVVLSTPVDAQIHRELAECYATCAQGTSSPLDTLMTARKHMALALELAPQDRRAQLGLVSIANAYLEEAAKHTKKKEYDEFEVQVAQELVKYGAEEALKSFQGSALYPAVQALLREYTDNL